MVWLGKSVPYYRHWVKNSQLPNNNTNTFRMSLIFSGVIVSKRQLQSLSPSREKREKMIKLKWYFCCIFFLFLSQLYYAIFSQRISIPTWPTPKITMYWGWERPQKLFWPVKRKIFFPFLRNYWYLNRVIYTIVPHCTCLSIQGIPISFSSFLVKSCSVNTHKSKIPYPSLSEVLEQVWYVNHCPIL